MSHRVNVLLEDDAWALLRSVPQGERSRVVNRALAEWFRLRRRALAARDMDRLRQAAPFVSEREILELLRAERERGGA
jgi:chromatin segregation and condensation protein Rec8/ScpA/Scc1 (kleisin family)